MITYRTESKSIGMNGLYLVKNYTQRVIIIIDSEAYNLLSTSCKVYTLGITTI